VRQHLVADHHAAHGDPVRGCHQIADASSPQRLRQLAGNRQRPPRRQASHARENADNYASGTRIDRHPAAQTNQQSVETGAASSSPVVRQEDALGATNQLRP